MIMFFSASVKAIISSSIQPRITSKAASGTKPFSINFWVRSFSCFFGLSYHLPP